MASLDKFKFNTITWDGDKSPEQFSSWVEQTDNVVRALKNGPKVVEFLDYKLDRKVEVEATLPSYLAHDEDFAVPPALLDPRHDQHAEMMAGDNFEDIAHLLGAAQGEFSSLGEMPPVDSTSQASLNLTSTSHRFELKSGLNYFTFLNAEERALDRYLFSLLQQNVQGSKRELLKHTKFPSYIQGMIVLHQHMDLARNTRKTKALDAVMKLDYRHDPQKFQVKAISAIGEVLKAKCTIMDFCFMALMNAFKGKSKQTQFQIAADINEKSLGEKTPFFDLIQGYCSNLAAVGDGKEQVHSTEYKCTNCGKNGHTKEYCRQKGGGKYKPDKGSKGGKGGKGGKSGKSGSGKKDSNGNSSSTKSGGDNKEKKDNKGKTVRFSPDDLSSMLAKLNAGNYHIGSGAKNSSRTQGHVAHVDHPFVDVPRDFRGQTLRAQGDSTHMGPPPSDALSLLNEADSLLRECELLTAVSPTSATLGDEADSLLRECELLLGVSPTTATRDMQPHGVSPPAATLGVQPHSLSTLSVQPQDEVIWLSLFGGMEVAAMAARVLNARITRFISVECKDSARRAASCANPRSSTFPGLDHSWHTFVEAITEDDIAALPKGALKLFLAGFPCQDFSSLRKILSKKQRAALKGRDPRPGVKGKTGRFAVAMLQVWHWVCKHHPDCELFVECVVFDDMPDWKFITEALGVDPIIINAADHSYTHRPRGWWLTFRDQIPLDKLKELLPPKRDVDSCMGPGRSIVRKSPSHPVGTIGASWSDDNPPRARTRVPVLVNDERYEEPQHLLPFEAARLMGLERFLTETVLSGTCTPQEWLQCIGNGWDLTVAVMLMGYFVHGPEYTPTHACATTSLQPSPPESLPSFGDLSDEDTLLQMALAAHRASHPEHETAEMMAQYNMETQLKMLGLLKAWDDKYGVFATQAYNGSVLDSGSSVHLSTQTRVLEGEDRITLTGFNQSSSETSGNGYVPLELEDDTSSKTFCMDLYDTYLLENAHVNIISLGKLLRQGWDFHFTAHGKECLALTPHGSHTVRIELGHDDILRMPHEVRHGKAAQPLPDVPGAVNAVRTASGKATAAFLHRTFNHTSMARVHRTLTVTRGYKPVHLEDLHCDACAMGNLRRRGLSHKKSEAVKTVMTVGVVDTIHSALASAMAGDGSYGSKDNPITGESAETSGAAAGAMHTGDALVPSGFCELNAKGTQVLRAAGHWWQVAYHRRTMAHYMYHVEIVEASGALITSYDVQGSDTIRGTLLRHEPQSELCTNVAYTFLYSTARSTFNVGFFRLYLGHPLFNRQPQHGWMGWIRVTAFLRPDRKRGRGDDGEQPVDADVAKTTVPETDQPASASKSSQSPDPCVHGADEEIGDKLRMAAPDPLLSNIAIYPPASVQLSDRYCLTTGIPHPCYPTRRAREEDGSGSDDDTDSDVEEEFEYVAPVAGRALGTRHVPRFDLDKLRPFEVMFVDNKDYEESSLVAFVLVDVKSNARFKLDVSSKKHNGNALARIVSQNGVHKLPYSCLVYSDGCGSMKHVRDKATQMGLNHAFVPPNEASLNEAEKVCDHAWAAARVLMLHSSAPLREEPEAVDMALYVHLRMATTASRGWLTPYEIIRGQQPDVSRLHAFYTRAFATTSRDNSGKRTLIGGLRNGRPCRLLGFHDIWSNTYRLRMDDTDRITHNINVVFDDSNFSVADTSVPAAPSVASDVVPFSVPDHLAGASREGALDDSTSSPPPPSVPGTPPRSGDGRSEGRLPFSESDPSSDPPSASSGASSDVGWHGLSGSPVVDIGRLPSYSYDPAVEVGPHGTPPGESPPFRTHHPNELFEHRTRGDAARAANMGNVAMADPRDTQWHRSVFIASVSGMDADDGLSDAALDAAISAYVNAVGSPSHVDYPLLLTVCEHLACVAQKDMNWAKALASPDRAKAVAARDKEINALEDTILERIDPSHPEYATAVREAINARLLLDVKRDGTWKARLVKQGFREDKATADGPDFNYYAHVAKLLTVRSSIFRANRGARRIAVKDVSTAFLQSFKYDGFTKWLKYRDPITKQVVYYRQHGSIYGEASAPVRWFDTIAPWLRDDMGFEQGSNEPCVFYHRERDLLIVLYVDDCLADGDEHQIRWIFDELDNRFKCKGPDWLSPTTPVDFIGMDLTVTSDSIYLDMERYVTTVALPVLGLEQCTPVSTPIAAPIPTDSPPLDPPSRRKFMTAVGCLGWLVNTGRPDCAYAHSRIAQHMALPTEGALQAVLRVFRYLKGTANLALSAPLYGPDVDVEVAFTQQPLQQSTRTVDHGWRFFCDTDFAGNCEPQNRRRSQNGVVAMQNGAAVFWASKVSSVAFAHPDIGEAHADTSSGAAEVYGAANATYDILHLSYVVDEMGLLFPKPIKLEMDNTTAEAFVKHSAFKSKLKHIDARQEWVRVLRDKDILYAEHVDTNDNVADLMTKILPVGKFADLRSKIMAPRPI